MSIIYKPEKEGKGVKKDTPKTFSDCLSIFFSHISVLIKSNLIFCLSILPLLLLSGLIFLAVMPDINVLKMGFKPGYLLQIYLIPLPFAFVGPAVAALTKITRDIGREIHVDVIKDYFQTFKRCFFKALPLSIIQYLFYIAAYFAFLVYFGSWVFFAVALIATAYFATMQKYLYLMAVSLDLSLFKMYKNAFFLTLIGIKNSSKVLLFIVIGFIIFVYLVFSAAYSVILLAISALFLLFLHFSIPRFFQNYYAFDVIIKNVVDPYYNDNGENTKITASKPKDNDFVPEDQKGKKYNDKTSVTEKSDYVYINGKLVKREVAEQEKIFKD